MNSDLSQLCQTLDHTFSNGQLLEQALTHCSCPKQSNERLEFLGDAVLGLIMTAEIYRRYPEMKEGQMSRCRSFLVNGRILSEIALTLGLQHYIRLGSGERKNQGQLRASILADSLEAVIGAIYLDTDLKTTQCCVLSWFSDKLSDLNQIGLLKDAKSRLQEWAQQRQLPLPHYQLVSIEGQPHQQQFEICCTIGKLEHKVMGKSQSRKKAEQKAAEAYLELIYVTL